MKLIAVKSQRSQIGIRSWSGVEAKNNIGFKFRVEIDKQHNAIIDKGVQVERERELAEQLNLKGLALN